MLRVISAQKTRQSDQKVISSYMLENLRNKYFKILSELVVSSIDELNGIIDQIERSWLPETACLVKEQKVKMIAMMMMVMIMMKKKESNNCHDTHVRVADRNRNAPVRTGSRKKKRTKRVLNICGGRGEEGTFLYSNKISVDCLSTR